MKTEIQQLAAMYAFALENIHSDFYRKLYGPSAPKKIDSIETWQSIPLLTRDAIVSVPLRERLFYPYSDIEVIRATSGTSGKNSLIVPRINAAQLHRRFLTETPRGLLAFYQSHHSLTRGRDNEGYDFPIIVCTDLPDLEASVQLAVRAEVDSLLLFPFVLNTLTPLLQKYKLDEKIKFIEIQGERITKVKYDSLVAIFPNAFICSDYGATELQSIAAFSSDTEPVYKNIFAPTKNFFWEVISEEGVVATKKDNEGYLVLTTLKEARSAFPLLRYSIGDYVRIINTGEDGSEPLYKIIGRLNVDMLKLSAGLLYAEEVSRALSLTHPEFTGEFECHIYHELERPRVVIHAQTKQKKHFSKALLVQLAETLGTHLRVGPNHSYNNLVQKNMYQKITLLTTTERPDAKTKEKPFHQHYKN